jgi:N utilization substance protein A
MLRRLLEMEVPEINQGLVEIKAIAREAGKRAKVAVTALRDGVDPVGACVGLRGVRIQSIVRDLNDEKIDVIEWNPDSATFIAKALSPARVSGVFLDEDLRKGKTAAVVVPEDQLSLAIGRSGVNARLGAKLTGWRIDIKSLPEAAAESLRILSTDDMFRKLAKSESEAIEQVEAILTKKAENRPIPPEEYQFLTSFVDRVQGAVAAERDTARQQLREKLEAIRTKIPASAYEVPLGDLELTTRVLNLLTEARYETAAQVMEQMELDEDQILGLQGFGPKAMQHLRTTLQDYEFPVIEVEEAAEAEEVVEAVPGEVEDVVAMAEAVIEKVETEEAVAGEEIEPALEGEEVAVIKDEADEGLEAVATVEPDEDVVVIESPADFEKVFEDIAEELEVAVEDKDAEEQLIEGEELLTAAQKLKQKKKRRLVEFDPESGETIVHRRRKRGGEEWEEYDV